MRLGISRDSAQLEVLLFHHPRRLYQLCISRHKYWDRIPYPERLQLLQSQPEIMLDVVQRNFGIVFQHRNKIFGRQPFPGISVQPRA